MSLFAGLERRVTAVVDRVFGDTILIIPQVNGQYGAAPDPEREIKSVVGVFDINPSTVQPLDKGQYDAHQPDVQAEKVHVSIDVAKLAAAYPSKDLWPRQGDILQATTIDGQPKAKVALSRPDGLGRIVFVCVPVQ